eukprot:scaffold144439_cov33-Prasinocladus_malaysianus.AAC.1
MTALGETNTTSLIGRGSPVASAQRKSTYIVALERWDGRSDSAHSRVVVSGKVIACLNERRRARHAYAA